MTEHFDIHPWRTFSVSGAASRLGISPATLRTWVRRHGVGPSAHQPGKHRRYSEMDLARLMLMRKAILDGASAGEGAQAAMMASAEEISLERVERALAQKLAQVGKQKQRRAPTSLHLLSLEDVPVLKREAVPFKQRAVELVEAALTGDRESCAELLAIQQRDDLIEWWTLFLRPALDRIASQSALVMPGITPRSLVGFEALQALGQYVEEIRNPKADHPSKLKNVVLVFSPESEDFALPAHVLTAALIRQGSAAKVILGGGNAEQLAQLMLVVRPRALVFMSDQIQPNLFVLEHLTSTYLDLPIFIGVREAVDTRKFRDGAHTTVLNSFAALYHEVHNAVRVEIPDAPEWPAEGGSFSLRSV